MKNVYRMVRLHGLIVGFLISTQAIAGNVNQKSETNSGTPQTQAVVTDNDREPTAQELKNTEPAADRMVWGTTALPGSALSRQSRLEAHQLGFIQFRTRINEHVDLGGQTLLPFGILAAGPNFRIHGTLGEKLYWGLHGMGSIINVYVSNNNDNIYYAVGGPMITYGDANMSFTLGAEAIAGGVIGEDHGWAYAPRIGFAAKLGKHVKFNSEFYSLNTKSKAGKAYALLYGFRFFDLTGTMYGDLSFVRPIVIGADKDFYRVFPIGFPLLSLGFQF